MARNQKTVTVETDNRDKGRTYLITEMSARAAERWATRALLAMQRAGVDVPEEALTAGAASVLASGVKALTGISMEDAEPLLDEMMACVQFVPSAGIVRPLIEDDIDEVSTLLWLRGEVVELHTGFSVSAALSQLGATARTASDTKPTSTSPSPSEPPSPPDEQH